MRITTFTLSLIALCAVLFGSVNRSCAADGMLFFNGSFAELQAAAEKAGKPYFVLFKIEECSSSQKYKDETFKNKMLGAYCNLNYLCYVVDGLDFTGGLDIAQLYGVHEYPTVCVFGPNGRLCQRITGYMTGSTMHLNLERAAREIDKFPELYNNSIAVNTHNMPVYTASATRGIGELASDSGAPAADEPFVLTPSTRIMGNITDRVSESHDIHDLHMMIPASVNADSFMAERLDPVVEPEPKPLKPTKPTTPAAKSRNIAAQSVAAAPTKAPVAAKPATPPAPAEPSPSATPPVVVAVPTATPTTATARMVLPASKPSPEKTTTTHKALPGMLAYSPAKATAEAPIACIYGTYDNFAQLNGDIAKVREQLQIPLWAYALEQSGVRTYILAVGAFATQVDAMKFADTTFGENAKGMQFVNLRKL